MPAAAYVIFGVVGTLVFLAVLLSVISPTLRRLWVVEIYVVKHLFIWLLDAIGLRKLGAKRAGKTYVPYTRPVMIRRFCEDMGPTYIKFGQIVASSSGMFPERYVVEFQKCLDRVRPFSYPEVDTILREELAEKADALTEIETKQLASASIAQVHTAKLKDGREVVIKVQRPGIERRIDADMRIMKVLAAIAARTIRDAELANPVGIVEDFSVTLKEELDFRKEAENLDRFNAIMSELGHNDVRAPKPDWDLTTRRVLVMERFFGTRVDDVATIRQRGVDGEAALIKGLRAWFQSVLFHGFFHGDVHAGNLMLLENEDAGFLDFGIVGRFDERQKDMVTDYLISFSTGDYRGLADVIIKMGGVNAGVDRKAFEKHLEEAYSPIIKLSFQDINYAEILPQIQRVASRHRMRLPKEFVLITKQMLYFDRYAKLLAPNLNIFTDPRLVMSMMGDIMKARAMRTAAPAAA